MQRVKSHVTVGQVVTDSLTGNEKLYIWLLCLASPVLSGAIFYYGWRRVLPKKAKSANTVSILAFLILIILFYGLIYLFHFNPLSLPTTGGKNDQGNATAMPYKDDSLGLSITPPIGWQQLSATSDSEHTLARFGIAKNDTAGKPLVGEIIILGEQLEPHVTPDAYFQDFQNLLVEPSKGGRVIEAGKIHAELPSYHLSFSSPNASGQPIIAKCIIVIKGGNSFVAIARSTEEGWKEFGDSIGRSLSTFKIK